MVKINFNLAPREAIEYLGTKGFKTSFHYDEIAKEAHHKSFTVAKMIKQDLLKDVLGSLESAIKEGKHFDDFKKDIQPTLQKKGWWGKQDIVNPKTGEVKTINIGSSRLRHIYKTNMRIAYSKARYKEQMKLPNSVYLRYVSEMLSTSRDAHKAIHNTVLHR
ncbi:phage minor head protein, partial [Sulfurimonas sp.]|uniref:phage head morphogenesis protein n=1 Tax=Sulfurimonas sp. TaxID=2022749 RepID=UPI0025DE4423